MEYILATFCCEDTIEDIKVPAFVPVEDLVDVFKKLYDADGQVLHTEPKGIILDKNKTLTQQGIEHGAKFTLS